VGKEAVLEFPIVGKADQRFFKRLSRVADWRQNMNQKSHQTKL